MHDVCMYVYRKNTDVLTKGGYKPDWSKAPSSWRPSHRSALLQKKRRNAINGVRSCACRALLRSYDVQGLGFGVLASCSLGVCGLMLPDVLRMAHENIQLRRSPVLYTLHWRKATRTLTAHKSKPPQDKLSFLCLFENRASRDCCSSSFAEPTAEVEKPSSNSKRCLKMALRFRVLWGSWGI